MAFLKMQQIINETSLSMQLFEAVKFAFMKIFDFLVKTAIFRTFLLFSGEFGQALWPKDDYFDQRIKNFHKSKVDGLKKLPTRACLFYDLLHFKECHFT